MKSAWTLCAVALLATGLVAQTDPAPKKPKKKAAAVTAADVQALKDAIAAQQGELARQQRQIQELRDQLRQKDQGVQQAQAAASDAAAKAADAQATATQQQQSVTALKSDVTDLKTNMANTVSTVQETQKNVQTAIESPPAIHYKGVSITPGGFVAAETVNRQRALVSDINTPFNSIPYQGNALAHITENNFTARQSRLSVLAESKVGSAKLTGYWEGDFLGTGVTSNNRQSNSYVFRQRILYGQAALQSGWIFTGGQQWSLVTENRIGIENRTEVPPLTIDSQYQVGFSWARQYGFRVVKTFGNKFALGASIEGPQATVGGRGFSNITTNNIATSTVTVAGNTFLAAPGSGGGLFNFVDPAGYSINKAPDFLVKAAVDPGYGHYEVYGIVSAFRNRIYPCGVVGTNKNDTLPPATPTSVFCPVDGSTTSSALGAFNQTRTGGGVGFNVRVPIAARKLEFALQGLAGDGVGRYGSAQLPDLTFRPDGTAALLRTYHGLAELEYHSAKWDLYAYGGAEYAARTAYTGYSTITVTKTPAITFLPSKGTYPTCLAPDPVTGACT